MEYQTLQKTVNRLFPAPTRTVPLRGLYLGHMLHTQAASSTTPLVYSNFVSSLDGRIAIEATGRYTRTVPDAITNPRDWRLYQELAGQADILITSGRYYRQSNSGEAQDDLPVGSQPEFDDIRAWRIEQGLAAQPDIVILSSSLDIPLAALEPYRSRHILVATGANVNSRRARLLENTGIEVITAGTGDRVDGRHLVDQLGASGYHSLYAIAGPTVLHTLVQADVLDRLYLTISCRLVGGNTFDTLMRGDLLTPAARLQLQELHHDPETPEGAGQLFYVFNSKHLPGT